MFGFVPLSDFVMPVNVSETQDVTCPIEMHRIVKQSASPSYLNCRIPVKSQLKVHTWEKVLANYWDVQLTQFLRYGFPVDFNRNSQLESEKANHSSATQHADDVNAYLAEELQHGAILGPFDKCPVTNCHTSPFMTREKVGAKHRRVIIDLSWPKGASVNHGVDKNSYMGTDFILTFPTVDHITEKLKQVGPFARLYKIDISRAFRHVRMDPYDYDLLGLYWNDRSYIDLSLPFGLRHGAQIFQRISDAIRYVMRQNGFQVINYVDDFIGVATPTVASRSYASLLELLEALGLDVSAKKLVAPATNVTCLGVNIDTERRTISIPDEKLQGICGMVKAWVTKCHCSKKQLQSLLGNLLYIHKCEKQHAFSSTACLNCYAQIMTLKR